MSDQTIQIDPELLEEFERKLLGFAEEVSQEMKTIGGKIASLGGSWRDKQFDQFKTEFEVTRLLLKTFSEEVKTAAPQLKRDAERAREFQRMKP